MLSSKLLTTASNAVRYLLRDQFTSDVAAPLVSPRTCEPGPGQLTITDAQGRAYISGGKLIYPTSNPGTITLAPSGFSYPASYGLFVNTVTGPDPYFYAELDNNAVRYNYLRQIQVDARPASNLVLYVYESGTGSSFYGIGVKSSLIYMVIRIGIDYYIAWTGPAWGGMRRRFENPLGNTVFLQVNDVAVLDWSGLTIPVTTQVNISDSTTLNARSSDFFLTYNLVAQAGVTQELQFRKSDESNYFVLRFDQVNGQVRLYKIESGTETQIGSTLSFTQVSGASHVVNLAVLGKYITATISTSSYSSNGVVTHGNSQTFNQSATGLYFSHQASNLKLYDQRLSRSSFDFL